MLKLYSTLDKTKTEFKPLDGKNVRIYVCGMTVYDFCHLGHARVMVAFDLLIRYLKYLGFTVKYVRNITDIDDKIIKRANENGEHFLQLVDRMIVAMNEDFDALNILKPDVEPRATEYIPHMQAMIKQLIEQKNAYQIDNSDVYFSVSSFKDYGKLSRKKLDELIAGDRVEIDINKKNPADFVLWKQAKTDEPYWESEFGNGRPGWHIECSAMSQALLGESFDIHGGGPDLMFPHHENEIAQSEACSHKKYANIWMHAGALRINNEKMSKSLNNFWTVKDTLKKYDAEVLRFFLASSHYRSPINFSDNLLLEAKQALTKLYNTLNETTGLEKITLEKTSFSKAFEEAMDDDLNTPAAISVLFDAAKEFHKTKDKNIALELKTLGNILGILDQKPQHFLKKGSSLTDEQIEAVIAQRKQARINKDWQKSDELRDYLLQYDIVLEDKADTTTWKIK